MNVCVACEVSGAVRRAFAARGHHAISVDLLPAWDGSPDHIVGDALDVVRSPFWDLVLAFPPCTYLCSSGLWKNTRDASRAAKTAAGLAFVRALMACPAPRFALENPIGCIGTQIRPADQYIQPYEFGDDASKRTGLWLRGLPRLVRDPRARVAGRRVGGVERWSNQTDSGQNRLGPSADRAALRGATYPGIAAAFAAQWG